MWVGSSKSEEKRLEQIQERVGMFILGKWREVYTWGVMAFPWSCGKRGLGLGKIEGG